MVPDEVTTSQDVSQKVRGGDMQGGHETVREVRLQTGGTGNERKIPTRCLFTL